MPRLSEIRAQLHPVEPRRGQIWQPKAKNRQHRRILITNVQDLFAFGLSSPEKGPGMTVRVRIPRELLPADYTLVEEAPTSGGKPYRVLVTGSRSWQDEQAIRDAIAAVVAQQGPENVILVHGACPKGADAIADRIGRAWTGLTVERHPADWASCGPDCPTEWHRRNGSGGFSYCPGAGLRRDAEMVALGAALCLVFIAPCAKPKCRIRKRHGSHGASHTALLAEKAGIPTRRFP